MSTGYSWEGIRQVRATLLGARHVPERLCGGRVYLGRYIKCSTLTFTFTILLVHIILHTSRHRSSHIRSHYLSLPRLDPDLKLICLIPFHKSFHLQFFCFLLDCLHGSCTCARL